MRGCGCRPSSCQEAVKLNFSYRFKVRTEWDDEALEADLSFGGVPFTVVLPWQSVVQMVSRDGGMIAVWPLEEDPDAAGAEDDEDDEPPQPAGPKLVVVK